MDLSGLIGVAYSEADCWAIARRTLERLGVDTPADPAALLAHPWTLGRTLEDHEPAAAGDVLLLAGPDGGDHVGVCVDRARFIHADRDGGSRIARIGVWARAGHLRKRVRPHGLDVRIPTPSRAMGPGEMASTAAGGDSRSRGAA